MKLEYLMTYRADLKPPVEVGAVHTPDSAVDVEVVGNLAYVADTRGGLRVVDEQQHRGRQLGMRFGLLCQRGRRPAAAR